MAFCSSCGNQAPDTAAFCTNCGKPLGGPQAANTGAYAAGYAPPVTVTPLDFEIHGDNLQVARVKMQPGQELFAEAGKMVYKHPQIQWETRMSGETLGEKLWGALKRKAMGESLFLTYFYASAAGEVGFAGDYPGRIQAFSLAAGQSILVQRDSFLFAQSTVQLNIAFTKRLGAGFLGGEGFILERLTGPGMAFIHAGGDHIEFTLQPGEVLQVDTGCIVAFEESVDYDIEYVGGIRRAIFGGEGLFLATLRGPGKVIIQSMTLEKMRRQFMPHGPGGDERIGLGAITNLLGSDD
jgi:uncharacterized protein (TIGR00266 family)